MPPFRHTTARVLHQCHASGRRLAHDFDGGRGHPLAAVQQCADNDQGNQLFISDIGHGS